MTAASGLDAAQIQRLEDLTAIRNTLARHSQGVDRADRELLRSAYATDGTVAYGFFTGQAVAFATILAQAQAAGATTMHRTSNRWIRFDGDTAVSESYITAYTETPDGPTQRLIGGRYLDRLTREADDWRIAHRQYVLDWNMNWPSTSAGGATGAHGADDPGRQILNRLIAEPARPAQEPPMTDLALRLDRLASREDIHNLAMAYCRATDRGDEGLFRSVFHEDGILRIPGLDGRAQDFAGPLIMGLRATPSVSHTIANEWIEVDGDAGVGEIYIIAFALTGEGRQRIVGGRYLDRYERRAGVWKIAERTFIEDFNINQPSTFETGGMFEALTTRGGHAPDDPVYALWKS